MLLVLCATMGGCGLFDSGVEWRGGPYILLWIDDPHDVTLNYDMEKGSSLRILDGTVFSVGWDGRYVVARRHPDGDKTVTQYFYLDSVTGASAAAPADRVVGPLSETAFLAKRKQLGLPEFTRTLESLE